MLSLHVITQNRAESLQRLIDISRQYVDNIRVCDGGSDDNTKAICKAYGIEYYYHKWNEDFSAQDNFLLSKAKKNEWILLLDDDEVPSLALCENLKSLISNRVTRIKIPCLLCTDGHYEDSVSNFIRCTKEEGAIRFTSERLFQNKDRTKLMGLSHRGLEPNDWIDTTTEYPFIHVKTTDDFIINACCHAYTDPIGQGYTIDDGQLLINHCKANQIHNNGDIRFLLKHGNLTKQFLDWIIVNSDRCKESISNWFMAYFYIYHPSLLFKYTNRLKWLEKPALKRFLEYKRGYSNGYLTQMALHPLLLEMLNNARIIHCEDMGIY